MPAACRYLAVVLLGAFLPLVAGYAQGNYSQSFENASALVIPDSGVGTPYPATIEVSGMLGNITNVTVTLANISHPGPVDVDILLVGPGGQTVMLMSDALGVKGLSNHTLTFSDAAAAGLPFEDSINSGIFRPTNFGLDGDDFPVPAPVGPYATTLATFNGGSPNGTWSLYVMDDDPVDFGSISGGWSLNLTTGESPTISNIADQVGATPAIPFTVNDADTALDSLTVSGTSSNLALIPNESIVFGGNEGNRTVTFTPAMGQAGTSTITLTVSDGVLTNSITFQLTVHAKVILAWSAIFANNETGFKIERSTNHDPRTSENPDGPDPSTYVTIGTTGPDSTSFADTDPNVVDSTIYWYRVCATNESGDSTYSETTWVRTFGPEGASSNTAPTINSVILSQTVNEEGSTEPLSFVVGDFNTAPEALTISISSSNIALVPDGDFALGGSRDNRTIIVTPAFNQTGTATITIKVSDGLLTTASETFDLNVLEVPDAPTISIDANLNAGFGVAVGSLDFIVGDVDSAADSLIVSGTSSNPILVPNVPASIIFGGSGTNRTITIVPATGQTGVATITVVVSDGSLSAAANLDLTIKILQTITFNAPSDRPFSTAPIALVATASSELPVSFSVLSGPAYVSDSNLILAGPGSITVRAFQIGNDSVFDAPDIDHTFAVAANFAYWQFSRFTIDELANPAVSGPTAIFGTDGLTNLEKYALGFEPTQNVSTNLPFVSVDGTDWVYTFTRPAGIGDVVYTVEGSNDLGSWVNVNAEFVSTSGGNDTWRARMAAGPQGRVFFRLRVTKL